MNDKPRLNPVLKLALEIGPLVLFLIALIRPALFAPILAPVLPEALLAGERAGIFSATAVFMVAVVVALAVSYGLIRRLPLMALVSLIVVMIFGGLTLALQDETFIKLKPTIIYVLFAVVLLGGLAFNKPVLAVVFDQAFHLSDEGWRKLTRRWAVFFLVLAILNEIVWRTQTTYVWGYFKVALIPLTFLFAAFQYPLLMKYAAAREQPAPSKDS